ncbi:MAG: hypothetical protein AB8F95_16590 [Bacteroidia bacterium]
MASGNTSNRQRMINMMYLVLLALLALNVSADVLDAFSELRQRLALSAERADEQSAEYAASMTKAIDDEFAKLKKTDNLGLKDTLVQVRSHTRTLIAMIDVLADDLHQIGDWDSSEQRYLRPDETELNFQYLMGADEMAASGRGNGAASRLRDSLNAYAGFITELFNAQVATEQAKQQPALVTDPAPRGDNPAKTWERHTFEGPVAANLATLEALKLDVFRQEQKLLELLNGRLGVNKYEADSLIAINMPVADVVTAGLPFETRMTVALTSSFFRPSFRSGNGRIQTTDGGNAAMLSVLADGSRIPDGKNEAIQSYSAMIEIPTRNGVEKVPVSGSFKVRRPEVIVTSDAVQVLYKNCANTLRIDVPALGEAYDPVISATGARVRKSEVSKRRFLIDPTANRCALKVATRSQGKEIALQKLNYRVIEPPTPGIEFKVNSRVYNGISSIPKGSRINIKLKPDLNFRKQFPGEVNYQVRRVNILLKDGLQPPRLVGTVFMDQSFIKKGGRVIVPTKVWQASPGSTLYFQLEGIERVNYRGKIIPDNRLSEAERTFAFTLR